MTHRTLAEAERAARGSTARRLARDRAQRTAEATEDVTRRLQAATAVVEARRRRHAAVIAVLRTPRHIPLRALPAWFEQAMQTTNESGADYMLWTDWSRP